MNVIGKKEVEDLSFVSAKVGGLNAVSLTAGSRYTTTVRESSNAYLPFVNCLAGFHSQLSTQMESL